MRFSQFLNREKNPTILEKKIKLKTASGKIFFPNNVLGAGINECAVLTAVPIFDPSKKMKKTNLPEYYQHHPLSDRPILC